MKSKEMINKSDLLKVLASVTSYYEPPHKKELKDAAIKAGRALDQFTRTNQEYRRLISDRRRKDQAVQSYVKRVKDQFKKELQACRNAIYLRGSVPETVKMIEKFLKKYPEAIR